MENSDGRLERISLPVSATPVLSLLRRAKLPDKADTFVSTIRQISDRLPAGWPIGLERNLLHRGFGVLPIPVAVVESPLVQSLVSFTHLASRSDKLQRRPPSELAAQILWDRAACGALRETEVLAAAECLGGAASFRIGTMMTTPFASGHMLAFIAPEQVRPRFERLLRRLNAPDPNLHPLLHAIAIYFETLLIHPLDDGNGRLARLLFQLSLRQTIGLRAPILPLGPASSLSRPALIGAYLAWEFDRNAQPLVDFVMSAVEQLVSLYVRTAKPETSASDAETGPAAAA